MSSANSIEPAVAETPARSSRGCCLGALALFLAALLLGGYTLYRIKTAFDEAYSVWRAADLVAEHLDRRDGAWPKSWEDLRPLADSGVGSGPRVPFAMIRELVEIDWQADPARLLAAPDDGKNPPFQVVWLRSGSGHHVSYSEPNRIILECLKERARRLAKPPPR